jgi:long-chain acyl-CoA synthetase
VNVLLTGATGSFGRDVAAELLARGCQVFALVRGTTAAEARRRAVDAVGTSPRLRVLHGDVTIPGIGLARIPPVDAILHAAASTEFGLSLTDARRANVQATRNVLELAQRIPGLTHTAYVSTAFVAGRRTGRVLESELRHTAGFVNSYEQSKYEAELLVSAANVRVPISIFRPSAVIESGRGGRSRARSALRFVLGLIRAGTLPVLPGNGDDPFDIIDAADAARAVVEIFLERPPGGIYHIASGDRAPRVGDIVDTAGAVRFANGTFASELESLRRVRPGAAALYDKLATFIDVLRWPKIFDTSQAEAVLGRQVQHGDPVAAVAA